LKKTCEAVVAAQVFFYKELKRIFSQRRHTRESAYPRDFYGLNFWIPAYAGMTIKCFDFLRDYKKRAGNFLAGPFRTVNSTVYP